MILHWLILGGVVRRVEKVNREGRRPDGVGENPPEALASRDRVIRLDRHRGSVRPGGVRVWILLDFLPTGHPRSQRSPYRQDADENSFLELQCVTPLVNDICCCTAAEVASTGKIGVKQALTPMMPAPDYT